MIHQMTQRERILAMAVGTIAFILINLFLGSVFVKHFRQLQQERASSTANLTAMKDLLAERDLWTAREKFLDSTQPKLEDRFKAPDNLRTVIKDIAAKHNIVIESPDLGTAASQPTYTSVTVKFETKSKWEDLVGFLEDLQAPDRFIVFEHADLSTDPTDKTQMRGKFTVAKWYAPS